MDRKALLFFDIGLYCLNNDFFEDAILNFTKAIELDNKFTYAYNNRGNAYIDKKEYNKAIIDYTKAIKLNEKYTNAYYNRGNSYAKINEYDKAILDFVKIIELDEKYTDAYYGRGNAYFEKKEYDKAIVDFTRVIKSDEKYTYAYYNRGNAYFEKKEYDKAIVDFIKAIELNGKFTIAFLSRGNAYVEKKEYEKAIVDYTKAIKLNEKYTNAYVNRGNAYVGKKEYDKAIVDFTKAIKLNEKYTIAYFGRGNAFFGKKEYDKAIVDYTKAIKLDKKYTYAYYSRGSVYVKKKEYNKVVVDYSLYLYLSIEENKINLTHNYLDFLQNSCKYSLITIKETFKTGTNSLIVTCFSKNAETLKSFILLINYLKIIKEERIIAILYYYLGGQVASYKLFDEVLDLEDIPLSSQELYYYAKSSFYVCFEKNTIINNCINECQKENDIDYYYLAQLHLLNDDIQQAKKYFIKSINFHFSLVMLTKITSGKEQKEYIALLKQNNNDFIKINNSIRPFQNLYTQFNPYFHSLECENAFHILKTEYGVSFKMFQSIWKEFSLEKHEKERVELKILEILAKEVIDELIQTIDVQTNVVDFTERLHKTENVAIDIYNKILNYSEKEPDKIENYLAKEIYEFKFKYFDFYFLLILDLNFKRILNTEQLFYLTFYLLNKIENLKDEEFGKIGNNILEFFIKLSGLSVVSTFFKTSFNVKSAYDLLKNVHSGMPEFTDYKTFKEEFWKKINYDMCTLEEDIFKEKYSMFTYIDILKKEL